MKPLRPRCLGLSLLVCAIAPSALAQTVGGQTAVDSAQRQSPQNGPTSSASEPDSALDWGHRGLDEFGRGEYRAALTSFQRAEQLQHSPVFLLYMARARRHLGDLAEAAALYQQVIDDSAVEQGPPAWQQAVRDARAELESLEPTPEEEDAERSLPPSSAPAEPEPSGLPSGAPAEATPPRPESPAPAEDAQHAADPIVRPTELPAEPASSASGALNVSSDGHRPHPAAYAALGVGGLGLVLATVTGAMAISRANEVKSRCVGTVCRPEDEPLVYEANRLGNLATVGAVVAIAGAATGVTLLLWSRGEHANPHASDSRMTKRSRDSALWLRVGPSELSLRGRF